MNANLSGRSPFKAKTEKSIGLHNVCFSFTPDGKSFFENMTMHFKVGQMNFICGKNGMGKSTLLKILSGNVPEKHIQGFLEIDDTRYNLADLGGILPSIAMVAQNFNAMLVDSYSFYQNMQFALLPQYPAFAGLPTPQPLPIFVEKYGINQHMPIHRLSGGQRQILAILMVLQQSPKILLLDEPTAALDEENAIIVMDFLQDVCVQKEITIIAIVHNLDVVEKYTGSSYFQLYEELGVRRVRSILVE